MSTQAEYAQVVQTASERLKQYLAVLPAAAWTQPSACARWEVRDVVAHLSSVMHLYRDSITRGLQADTSTPEGRREPRHLHSPEARRQWMTGAAQNTIARRESLGNALLEVFCTSVDHLQHVVAHLSPHAWTTSCYHPWGLLPVRALVLAGVFELTIHGWDIRSALEPSAPLAPDALAVIPEFFAACPHWFFTPDTPLATPLRYRWVLTGALSGPWDMVVEGDTAHIAAATTTLPAHATFRCDGETFTLLMCGRMGWETARGEQRVIPTGDEAVVREFTKWFPGV